LTKNSLKNIGYKRSVSKDFKNIDISRRKSIKDELDKELPKIDGIKTFHVGVKGFPGLYKYRVGDYRAVYTLDTNIILVLHVIHRKQVYKRLR